HGGRTEHGGRTRTQTIKYAEDDMANKPRNTRARKTTPTAPSAASGTAASAVGPRAAIIGANRIPFGKAGGAYASATNLDMLTAALDGLVARYQLQREQ